MTLDTLLIYVVASLALAVIPGPTMLLALSNGIDGGMRRASWGIAGASLGSITLIAVVALGLGSLLAASEWLFNAIRVAGVAYLVWLGFKLWRSEATDLGTALAKSAHRSAPAWPHRPVRSLARGAVEPEDGAVLRGLPAAVRRHLASRKARSTCCSARSSWRSTPA
jgi:homoserine/homoserine lactone efflux protein